MGYSVNGSVRSANRLPELSSKKIVPFIIDLEKLSSNIHDFLRLKILIISVPYKNVDNFRILINEIERSEIEKVLFISSTSIYENKNKIIHEEDGEETLTHPLFAIENMLKNSSTFKTTIVRFGGLIGYNRNPAEFFRNGKVVKDPEAKINMIHRDDCVKIMGKIIEQSVWGEVFNCCADSHPTKKEYYSFVSVKAGLEIPQFEKSQDINYKIISNQKLKQVLNYNFIHPDLMKINYGKSN